MDFTTNLTSVVGAKTAAALLDGLKLGTVGQLLYHFPRRYAQRGEHTDIAALVVGEHVTILAQVQSVRRRPMRQRRGSLLEVVVGDGKRSITLTFFNQAWRERELTPGRWALFAGKVGEFRGARQLQHPEYQIVDDAVSEAVAPADGASASAGSPSSATSIDDFAGALIPVYPATSATPTWVIARCIRVLLDTLSAVEVSDPLPEAVRDDQQLMPLGTALADIHRPPSDAALAAARRRLAFDEAFGLQTVLALRRMQALATPAVARPPQTAGLLAAFDATLPFTLTTGQRTVGAEVAAELASDRPMQRLLQGEVGSGKTIVALRAMLQTVDAGGQAALLAPTEVLAAQHAHNIRELLGPLAMAGELGSADQATRVALLTGSLSAPARRTALAEAASGTAGIVIGTHALLSTGVEFHDLGLVIVDEQHRFGVEQRDALRAKGAQPPHMLVMTATPIPRTVAMTVFGDLDVSVLDELPAGRSPIATTVVPVGEKPAWLDRAWQRAVEEVAAGHQAYLVFPRIGDDEATADEDAPAALLEQVPSLRVGPFVQLRTGVLHGRLSADEKDRTMAAFARGELDVLFATTIVEVGVDVPNATMMVIVDADRFGVSQLHQLRGRVGRGSASGLCLLITGAAPETPARQRLDAVAATLDGFRLAELDLEQRREGDVLGAAQSGRRSALRILSLLRDGELITAARTAANAVVAADPTLADHPQLAAAIADLVDADQAAYLEKS